MNSSSTIDGLRFLDDVSLRGDLYPGLIKDVLPARFVEAELTEPRSAEISGRAEIDRSRSTVVIDLQTLIDESGALCVGAAESST